MHCNMATKSRVFLVIFFHFLGVSRAQGITNWSEYMNKVPGAVIFWEQAPQSVITEPHCSTPYVELTFVKQHIKNCVTVSETEGSCQRNCGSYQRFNITCRVSYRSDLMWELILRWFPHTAIPYCTVEELNSEKYRAKENTVIFWEQRNRPVRIADMEWCGRPVLEDSVTIAYINNCDSFENQYAPTTTCTLGCSTENEKFEINCAKDQGKKRKWFPTRNIALICDRNHYMEQQNAVIFWKAHPDPDRVNIYNRTVCNAPYLQPNVTERYIDNCTTENNRYGTCDLLCANSNKAITVDILCWKNDDGDKLRWYPLRNYSKHCDELNKISLTTTGLTSAAKKETSENFSTLEANTTPSIATTDTTSTPVNVILVPILGLVLVCTILFIVISHIVKKKKKNRATFASRVEEVLYDEIDLTKAVPLPEPELPPRFPEATGYLRVLEPYHYDTVGDPETLEPWIRPLNVAPRKNLVQHAVDEKGRDVPDSDVIVEESVVEDDPHTVELSMNPSDIVANVNVVPDNQDEAPQSDVIVEESVVEDVPQTLNLSNNPSDIVSNVNVVADNQGEVPASDGNVERNNAVDDPQNLELSPKPLNTVLFMNVVPEEDDEAYIYI